MKFYPIVAQVVNCSLAVDISKSYIWSSYYFNLRGITINQATSCILNSCQSAKLSTTITTY